jgi:hypothetical protein
MIVVICRNNETRECISIEKDRDTEGNLVVRLIVEKGDLKIVSEPLDDLQVQMLAVQFSGAYFERTKRVVWPCGGAMLHAYEKAKVDAEDEHLKWMQTSPAEENRERAPEYARAIGRPLAESPSGGDLPDAPATERPRRRRLVVNPAPATRESMTIEPPPPQRERRRIL